MGETNQSLWMLYYLSEHLNNYVFEYLNIDMNI